MSKKSMLYTRTGDDGTSSLYSGERRSKDDLVFEALGTLDEVSSHIGLARVALSTHKAGGEGESAEAGGNDVLEGMDAFLFGVQSRLVELGSHVATPPPPAEEEEGSDDEDDPVSKRRAQTVFPEHRVEEMEAFIDQTDASLPPLTMFILPGGTMASAHIHVARAVTRRAERTLSVLHASHQVSDPAYRYVNRLSDALFAVARAVCAAQDGQETIYAP